MVREMHERKYEDASMELVFLGIVFVVIAVLIASQVSLVHVCLLAAAEQFDVSMGTLIRKTLPKFLVFCGFVLVYYNLLRMF